MADAANNPLHPDISIHFVPTVLYTFPKVLTRRIELKIQSVNLNIVIISFILMTPMFDLGVIF